MATRTQCPACGATIRTGEQWCTQCYADLRPGGTDDTPPAAPATAGRRPRHRAGDEDETTPAWPCPTCGTVNDLSADACRSCGSGFLAPLTADRGLPAFPALAGLPRGARIGAAVGLVLIVLIVLGTIVWLLS
jgi:hypothetical protein